MPGGRRAMVACLREKIAFVGEFNGIMVNACLECPDMCGRDRRVGSGRGIVCAAPLVQSWSNRC